MKKVIIIMLFIILIGGTYFTYDLYNKNINLKEDIKNYEEQAIINQEEYREKKQELELLKEENKSKIKRLEDIKVWNEEVVNHLN